MPQDQGSSSNMAGGGAAGSGSTAGVVGNAAEAVRDAISSASDMAGNAYEQGSRYVRDASGHIPDVGDYAERVRRPLVQNPLITALAVGAIGYLAAFLIHGGGLESIQVNHSDYAEHASKRSRRRHRHRR